MTVRNRRVNRITLCCVLAVMAAAVLVRLPAVCLSTLSETQRAAYITESGLPYLTDPDSYYYARITETFGTTGGARTEDGVLWDTQSQYPEGRSADYQQGIVWMARIAQKLTWPLFHTDLYVVEYWMPAILAALTALAAFFLGKRMSGVAGGVVAGVLVACAPAFVARVLPGRFDTDMFTALLDVLLILAMTEALRVRNRKRQIAAALCFGLTTLAYYACWSFYAVMFAALTVVGGVVFLVVAASSTSERKRVIQAWLLSTGMAAAFLLAAGGPSFFSRFLGRVSWAGSLTESGTLPNLLASVTELNHPAFAPVNPTEWFVAYISGKSLTVLNGIGGAAVGILCMGGLVLLVLKIVRASGSGRREKLSTGTGLSVGNPGRNGEQSASGRWESVLYLCVLGTWLIGAFVASGQGIRFVEHLAVPVGVLAGCCVGWIAPLSVRSGEGAGNSRSTAETESRAELQKNEKGAAISITVALCVAAVIIPLAGSAEIARENRPSVSSALAEGMEWIEQHASDPEAVIASWWDLGYFYEYASGHPVFWDGGSQSGMRAILIGRALTERDGRLSARILKMLAVYGNEPVQRLVSLLGEERAFAALWDVLSLDAADTAAQNMRDAYGLARDESEELAKELFPAQEKEIYLVLSGDMLYKLGWIEYYANWNFAGNNVAPTATIYSIMPDASADLHTDSEEARNFFEARAGETIWKLFFQADGGSFFTPVFEKSDGVSQIQIWRVVQE